MEFKSNNTLSHLAYYNKMTLGGWFRTSKDGTILAKHNEYRVFIEGDNLKITILNKNGTPYTATIKKNVNNGKWHFFAVSAKINTRKK